MALSRSALTRAGVVGWAVIAVALVLRIGAVIALDGRPLATDSADYDRHARSLADGHGYPTTAFAAPGTPSALRPPGYPVFLASLYKLSGNSATFARVAQALLGTLTVALLGLLAARLLGRRAGLATAAIAAVYPPFVLNAGELLTEPLFLPVEVGALLAALNAQGGRRGWAAVAGALAGLAVITRQPGLLLIVPLVVILLSGWRAPGARRPRIVALVIMLGVTAAVMAPWTVRNAVRFGAFVPSSLQDGLQLSGTMNDQARNDPVQPAAWRPPNAVPLYADIFRHPGYTEEDINSRTRSRALHYLRKHPGYVPKVLYWNTARLLHLGGAASEHAAAEASSRTWFLQQTARFGFYALAVLALAGALTRPARSLPAWFWLGAALFFAVAVFSGTLIRYRLPVDVFLVVLAGLAVATALERRNAEPRTA